MIAKFKSLEEEESASKIKNKKGNTTNTLPLRERNPNTPDFNGLHHCAPASLSIPADQDNFDEGVENKNEIDDDLESSTPPSTTNSTFIATAKPSKADVRTAKRAAKSAKSQLKSLKNQTKLSALVSVKSRDVEHVALVLHGEQQDATDAGSNGTGSGTGDAMFTARHPLADDKSIEDVIERNRRYVANIQSHKAALLREASGRRKKERMKRVEKQKMVQKGQGKRHGKRDEFDTEPDSLSKEEDDEMLIDAILARFDIVIPKISTAPTAASDDHFSLRNKRHSSSSNPTHSHTHGSMSSTPSLSHSHGHTKLAVLAQLRVTIADDLIKHENEQRNTLIRAGGFWRYVGRPVFERMCVIGERICWRTGVIRHDGGEDNEEQEQQDDIEGAEGLEAEGDEDDVEGNADEGADINVGELADVKRLETETLQLRLEDGVTPGEKEWTKAPAKAGGKKNRVKNAGEGITLKFVKP